MTYLPQPIYPITVLTQRCLAVLVNYTHSLNIDHLHLWFPPLLFFFFQQALLNSFFELWLYILSKCNVNNFRWDSGVHWFSGWGSVHIKSEMLSFHTQRNTNTHTQVWGKSCWKTCLYPKQSCMTLRTRIPYILECSVHQQSQFSRPAFGGKTFWNNWWTGGWKILLFCFLFVCLFVF